MRLNWFGSEFVLVSLLLNIFAAIKYSGYLDRPDLPLINRLSLLSLDALYLCLASAVLWLVVKALSLVSVRSGYRTFLVMVFSFVWTFFLAASWSQYSVVGTFIGVDSLEMLFANSTQIVEHAFDMVRSQLIVIFISSTILTVFCVLLVTGKSKSGSQKTTRLAVAFMSGLAMMMPLATFLTDSHSSDEKNRIVDIIKEQKLNGLGPAYKIYIDTLELAVPPRVYSLEDESFVIYRPKISLDEYLSSFPEVKGLRKKNVILLVVESLRPDALVSFAGHEPVMPALDGLALRSVRGLNHYAQSSHSNYADVSLLSGHYPLRSPRTHYYSKNPAYPRLMLQDILSALGYKTAIFSSQNENWGGMINYIDSGNWNHIQHAGNYQGTVRVEYNRYQNEDTKAYAERMVKEGKSGKIDDSVTIDDVIQWLDTIDDDPYYLYINLQNSHAPYFVPENFTRQFLRDDEAVLKIDEGRLIELTIGQMKAAYFDSLNYIDFQISRLLQSLKERHQLNNTVIVITGDTATSFDEIENDGGHVTHILGNGGRLVEEAIKTPIIFYSAEHEQRDIEHVTQHVDVIPTVLDIMGLPPHPVYQGHSIFDDNYPLPAYAFITAQSPAAKENAVVANGWKVVYDELRNKVMVENLRNDIQSSRDMSQYLVVLNRWMSAQLDYYSDPLKMERLYPPVLRNVNFNCCIGIDEERGRP